MDNPNRNVVIVGRPNVGKSALFNRLVGRRVSIVHDEPGVTRDRIIGSSKLLDPPFSVVDTGGIGGVSKGGFESDIRFEAELAMTGAGVILFVVDGQSGWTPADQAVADRLRKAKAPVILVVNKIDVDKHENFATDFARAGFNHLIGVSAAHGRGIDELVGRLDELLPRTEPGCEPGAAEIKVAMVGRPNTGKSSLINRLLDSRRTLVSEVAGTTRDAVDIPFQYGDSRYLLIDTAGIRPRRRSGSSSSVEVFSVMRSERSIRRADLCVLVVDGAAGITAQDKKIAGLIQEARKPCLVVVNKLDLIQPEPEEESSAFFREAREEVYEALFFLPYAPVVFLSAKTGGQIARLFRAVERVRHASRENLSTGKLNRLLRETFQAHPPPSKAGRRFKLFYVTQATDETRPIPPARFVLFVNDPDLLPASYQKYLENAIRRTLPLEGVPIEFDLRPRAEKGAANEPRGG